MAFSGMVCRGMTYTLTSYEKGTHGCLFPLRVVHRLEGQIIHHLNPHRIHLLSVDDEKWVAVIHVTRVLSVCVLLEELENAVGASGLLDENIGGNCNDCKDSHSTFVHHYDGLMRLGGGDLC